MPSCSILPETVIVPFHLADPYCIHYPLIILLEVGALSSQYRCLCCSKSTNDNLFKT